MNNYKFIQCCGTCQRFLDKEYYKGPAAPYGQWIKTNAETGLCRVAGIDLSRRVKCTDGSICNEYNNKFINKKSKRLWAFLARDSAQRNALFIVVCLMVLCCIFSTWGS